MVAVIWIDWYAYHVARFRALAAHPAFAGQATGIELVGQVGVHRGLAFRERDRGDLAIETLAPGKGWHDAGQWPLAVALWRRLDRLQPTLVLVPGYYTLPAVAAALWARLHGKRSVLMTESGAQDQSRSAWKEAFKSILICALFEFASAGGRDHADYLAALRFPRERIRRYYDTVDNDFFSSQAAACRQDPRHQADGLPIRYFLSVGRLAPEKNLEGLLLAFARYRAHGGTWSLVLAGDGPMRHQLEGAVRQMGLSGAVLFAGMQTTAALPRFYAGASCFVLPSTREPWGLVVNEAMASGLPVLVSQKAGCAADLVEEGRNGYSFDPNDTDRLAGLMRAVEALSEEERSQMGARSAERIALYAPQHWAEEIATLLPAGVWAAGGPAKKSGKGMEAAA